MAYGIPLPISKLANDAFVIDARKHVPKNERLEAEQMLIDLAANGFKIITAYAIKPIESGLCLVLFPFTENTLAIGQLDSQGKIVLDRLIHRDGGSATKTLGLMGLI